MVTATLPFRISFISFPCAMVESDFIAGTTKPTAAFRIFLLTFRIPYFRIFQEVLNRPRKVLTERFALSVASLSG